ncbi:hypothetical protein M0R19_03210 [Candidatus Pacearchaeota archaeon]|jgi:hypothetical protein|nr:hypothetical protein [Candidatus Pacearchaeota archaeon]
MNEDLSIVVESFLERFFEVINQYCLDHNVDRQTISERSGMNKQYLEKLFSRELEPTIFDIVFLLDSIDYSFTLFYSKKDSDKMYCE